MLSYATTLTFLGGSLARRKLGPVKQRFGKLALKTGRLPTRRLRVEQWVEVWEVDRSISRQYLSEVVESVTGIIPERLADDIKQYNDARLAERITAEQRSRDMD
jgi:hypothetical protein